MLASSDCSSPRAFPHMPDEKVPPFYLVLPLFGIFVVAHLFGWSDDR